MHYCLMIDFSPMRAACQRVEVHVSETVSESMASVRFSAVLAERGGPAVFAGDGRAHAKGMEQLRALPPDRAASSTQRLVNLLLPAVRSTRVSPSSGSKRLAELSAVYNNPGGDHGLAFAIPAEDPPRRYLGILPLDLAPLADVCSQDARCTRLELVMSRLEPVMSRYATQLS
jgi:hypothetical protein